MPMLKGQEGQVGCRLCGLPLGVKSLGDASWWWDFDEETGNSFCGEHTRGPIFRACRDDWAQLKVVGVKGDCCPETFPTMEAFYAHKHQ